jgi:hypothetical protein
MYTKSKMLRLCKIRLQELRDTIPVLDPSKGEIVAQARAINAHWAKINAEEYKIENLRHGRSAYGESNGTYVSITIV